MGNWYRRGTCAPDPKSGVSGCIEENSCGIIVLVPGAGGMAWYWHRLVPLLHSRGIDHSSRFPADDEAPVLRDICRNSHPRDRGTK